MKRLILILILGLAVLFIACTLKFITTSEKITSLPEVILKPDEALELLIELDNSSDTRPDKGYSYNGIDLETGYYMFSWSNPGKGTGASFSVVPDTGDVYSMGKKTINLLEPLKKEDRN